MSRSSDRKSSGHRRQVPPLRVIGGRLRGSKIDYLGDECTRPMKQRVREAAFNLIGRRAANTHVLDLFAGTGALAWEALSRGASSATVIERHFPTARVLQQNAGQLGLAEHVEMFRSDAFHWMRHHSQVVLDAHALRPWIAFCSPPYDFYVTRLAEMLELIEWLVGCLPVGSLLVVESDERFDADRLPDATAWDVRTYRPAQLALRSVDPPANPSP